MTKYPMAYIAEPGRIQFRELEIRDPKPDEVMIKIHRAAICGSDLHLFKGKHPSVQLPSAVGHELSGIVLKTGTQVTRFAEGDRVTVEPVIACGKCWFCQRGKYHLCSNISFQYRVGQGAFTTLFYAPENRTYKLPETVSLDAGALIEPLSVALHAVKKSGVTLGDTTAVFGAGAIGLLVCALLKQLGASKIICSDVNDFRLQKSLEVGASFVINNQTQDAQQLIREMTGNHGVDHAFEAVGKEQTLAQALYSVCKGGKVTLLGIFEEKDVVVPVHLFIQRELALVGSQGYAWDFEDAINLAAAGLISLDNLITHTISLENLQDGFELLLSPGNQAIKVLAAI